MKRADLWQGYLERMGSPEVEFGDPLWDIRRLLLDYNRYAEAKMLGRDVGRVGRVVDVGCGVGDIGIWLLKQCAAGLVVFYDLPEMAEFMRYRLRAEGIPREQATVVVAPVPPMNLLADTDLAVFSEVLEHLDNPLEWLEACGACGVGYIFTTKYPFVSPESAYWDEPWHTQSARVQLEACQDLLADHYACTRLFRSRHLCEAVR